MITREELNGSRPELDAAKKEYESGAWSPRELGVLIVDVDCGHPCGAKANEFYKAVVDEQGGPVEYHVRMK